ncbi:MAG: HAMP domain-containing histidine kinase [Calditrichales bacterium]|nr:MAG: HAMP domain-containing histidine kinase [Calditrichales bacterium]
MLFRRLFFQLFLTIFVLLLISLTVTTLTSSKVISDVYLEEKRSDLASRAALIEPNVTDYLYTHAYTALDSLCKSIGPVSNTRITVILPDGKVVADSEESPDVMENHADRPEIKVAVKGNQGSTQRYSFTMAQKFIYIAIPLYKNQVLIGVLRTSVPVTFIDRAISLVESRLFINVLLIALIIAIISWVLSRRISHPIEEIQQHVQQLAQGNFQLFLPKLKSGEISDLADSLNKMTEYISEKINSTEVQKSEQAAILESMVEGVIAINPDGRVINLNKAARELFDLEMNTPKTLNIFEMIRNSEFHAVVHELFLSHKPIESDIIFNKKGERFLNVHGTVLKNSASQVSGAVIVLDDLTRLRKLEMIRRDFVANVSHEIRTPLTAIKGFAETLLDGAMDEPASTKKFMSIILKQANRLNAIIDDLLLLAKLEAKTPRAEITFEPMELKPLLESAVQICEGLAEKKGIKITVDCADDTKGKINPDLIEQALVNLINNAVTYSPENTEVTITVRSSDNLLTIDIIDQGPGIEKKHLPRLFERFYRVDKARSRNHGGTGLGLSIVKHILNIHGGQVEVDSTLGKGSRFTLKIPG